MNAFKISIDGREVEVEPGQSVLQAARILGINIPTLCYLEKIGALTSCLVCLVKVVQNGSGKLVPSCGTIVQPGMVIESETEEVHEARRTALELLFSDHVGDCLSPCNRLCPLQLNVARMIRQIQSEQLREAVVTVRQALPLPAVLGRLCHHPCEQGCRRGTWDDSAEIREMERHVADTDLKSPEPWLPSCRPATGKSVVILGAGPTGLSAAYFLAGDGHAVTLVDRNRAAGGSLRKETNERELPPSVLDAELRQFERRGIQFKLGFSLGQDVTLEGLLRGFDAVLITIGDCTAEESARLGVAVAGKAIKADPTTCQTNLRAVFAAGAVVRPVKQLVKAMSEGRIVATCISQFLAGRPIRRLDKPFSSVMGKLDRIELKTFLAGASAIPSVAPACGACAGFTREEAKLESHRCLHCDCRSSGNCALQHYAQLYDADANRFRSQRRKFEQHLHPGGVIFEPGKCILCGLCVEIARRSAEPLGLTFVGRGFDVRVAAPMGREFHEGLQEVAAECVKACPTGAIVFGETKSGRVVPGGFRFGELDSN